MQHHTRTTRALGALTASTVLLLSACGTSGDGEANDADIAFASQMIPHHEQAVEMAEMVDDEQVSPEVQDLADRIEDAQDPEIEQMMGWLEDWGAKGADSGGMDHGDMDHGDMDMDMGDMPGMMSAEDMSALEAADGEEFERLWLEMMIEHHRGAVEMAETEVADGQADEAVALAEEIASSQQQEIEEMQDLLER